MNMKAILLSFCTVLLGVNTLSASEEPQDTSLPSDLYSEVIDLYNEARSTPESAMAAVDSLIDNYYGIVDPTLKGMMNEVKGDCFYMFSRYDSALYYFLEARMQFETISDSAAIAINSIYAAEIYIETGVHESAALHLFTAQEYFEAQGDSTGLIDVNFALSILYFDRSEFLVSLKYAEECLRLTLNSGIDEFLPSTYTQLSNVHLALGNIEEAENYAILAVETNREYQTGEMERAYALVALADVFNTKGKYQEATRFLDSAAYYADKVGDSYALIYQKNSKARNSHGQGRIDEAWAHLDSAMSLSAETKALAGLRFSVHTAIELSRAEGDFEKALMYTDSLDAMTMNLLNDDFEFISLSNDFRKERAETRELKQKMQIDDLTLQRNTALLFLTLLVAFGAGIAWFFQYRANQRVTKMNAALEDRNKMISKQNARLDEQTKALIENQRLLKKSNADKDKLLTLISHDLRSPVAQVKSIAELVLKGAIEGDELIAFFERINESTDKSLANLTEVLVWARSQMDKGMSSNLEAVDAKAAVANAFQLIEADYQAKEVEFICKCPDPSPKVYCDESHLGIILRNLLSNALKFSHRGGEVYVRLRMDGAWVHFMVEDRGVGMPEEVRQRIFEHGERVTAHGTENEAGTGTGLQLVHEFTQANGGMLEITSEEGEGTSIGVSFRKA